MCQKLPTFSNVTNISEIANFWKAPFAVTAFARNDSRRAPPSPTYPHTRAGVTRNRNDHSPSRACSIGQRRAQCPQCDSPSQPMPPTPMPQLCWMNLTINFSQNWSFALYNSQRQLQENHESLKQKYSFESGVSG